jgi:hypothetical protein
VGRLHHHWHPAATRLGVGDAAHRTDCAACDAFGDGFGLSAPRDLTHLTEYEIRAERARLRALPPPKVVQECLALFVPMAETPIASRKRQAGKRGAAAAAGGGGGKRIRTADGSVAAANGAADSPAATASVAVVGAAAAQAAETAEALVTRHAGVLGLAAIVSAHPYSIPPRLIDILIRLARHVSDPSPILATAKKCWREARHGSTKRTFSLCKDDSWTRHLFYRWAGVRPQGR